MNERLQNLRDGGRQPCDARAKRPEYGRGRESCPYSKGSAERQGWLEGFDDLTADDSGKSGRVDDADRG